MTGTDLLERLGALETMVEHGAGRLPDEALARAREVLGRAGERRRLSADHTVVALAGATGSGKSSLFNALTELDLARVGVRRPTTSEALACIWGADGAGPLLDWLDVPSRHRLARESALDTGGGGSLDGLVLLDLPDHDSTEVAHRVEVDRLVQLVDVLVWVVDPQKYADAVLHDRYLRPLARLAPVTVVVLNQVDRLHPDEVAACRADLRRLLDAEGLASVPLVAVSAVTGQGVGEVRRLLQRAVAARTAATQRLLGDVTGAAAGVAEACAGERPPGVGRGERATLVDALADAAGAGAIADAVGRSHLRRARASTGWPPVRWLARLRPDPLRRLRLARPGIDPALVRTSLPAPTPVQQARSDAAVRAVVDRAAAGVPLTWRDAVRRVAAARSAGLPDALDQALAGVDLGTSRAPLWWRLVGLVQWVLLAVTLAGLAWLGLLAGLDVLRLPQPETPSRWGLPVPTLMLLGGVVAGMLVAVASRLLAGAGARRRRSVARRRLRTAVAEVADREVVAPVEAELAALARVRAAATAAAGG